MRTLDPSLLARRPGLPLLGIVGIAIATSWFHVGETNWRLILAAMFITAVLAVSGLGVLWQQPRSALLLLPICSEGVIAIFRHAQGGTASGYGALTILPVVWVALAFRRRDVLIMVACTAVTLGLPIALLGAPAYPASELRRIVLLTVVACVVGLVIEGVVAEQRRLSTYAQTDALTELPNRRSWDDQLLRALAQADRSGEPLSVAVCDVNGLKQTNDRHGHAAGDDLLKSVARRLRRLARTGDLVARIGGDEFALLFFGATEWTARDVVERVLDAFPAGDVLSVGVAQWDANESADELVARADRLMYERKSDVRPTRRLADVPS